MKDYLSIGSSPYDEKCVQVQQNVDYLPEMRKECQRFIELLRKKFGPEPTGAGLYIKSNDHDFGPYLEVNCRFDDQLPESVVYAFACEAHSPQTWTDDTPYDWKKKMAESKEEE